MRAYAAPIRPTRKSRYISSVPEKQPAGEINPFCVPSAQSGWKSSARWV